MEQMTSSLLLRSKGLTDRLVARQVTSDHEAIEQTSMILAIMQQMEGDRCL